MTAILRRKVYQVIDQHAPAFPLCKPIEKVLGEGEVSGISNDGGFGLGAYLREGTHWDRENVWVLQQKYRNRGLNPQGIPNATDPCIVIVDAEDEDPDKVMRDYLEEFNREILKDPTLEFRIKDDNSFSSLEEFRGKTSTYAYVYGIKVAEHATHEH